MRFKKFHFLMDADKGAQGGGDGGAKSDKGSAPDPKDAKIAELEKALSDMKSQAAKSGSGDSDLVNKARAEKEDSERKASETKVLETALKFDLEAEKFLESNKSLLPAEIPEIFKQAKKENYSNAIEKAQALKTAIIQSFFSVQANVDLLTPGLKSMLDDYMKLTKNGKQERSTQIYDSVFEPAFEMVKRMKRAEALEKGHGQASDEETKYREKLSKLSRKHYLGEKADA